MGPRRYAENLKPQSLRTRREKTLRKTLRDMATKIGVTHSYLAQLERGDRKTCSVEVALAVLEAYEIDADQWPFYFQFHGLSQARFRVAA